jgi:hypothetical protein
MSDNAATEGSKEFTLSPGERLGFDPVIGMRWTVVLEVLSGQAEFDGDGTSRDPNDPGGGCTNRCFTSITSSVMQEQTAPANDSQEPQHSPRLPWPLSDQSDPVPWIATKEVGHGRKERRAEDLRKHGIKLAERIEVHWTLSEKDWVAFSGPVHASLKAVGGEDLRVRRTYSDEIP